MPQYEYNVVPAPKKGVKIKGAKTTDDRFAHALSVVMNAQAAEGWEYQRTDTLPCEERSGLTGRTTTYVNMLVFRRALAAPADAVEEVIEEPVAADIPAEPPMTEPQEEVAPTAEAEPEATETVETDEAEPKDDAEKNRSGIASLFPK